MDQVEKKPLPQPPAFEGMSQYRPPLCFELVGQRFELVMDDGYDYELNFLSREKLLYGKLDGEKKEYAYECLKPEDVTYFINFEKTGAVPRTGVSIVLDLEQNLVTANICTVGVNPKWPKMPVPKIVFGAIKGEDGTAPTIRHGYTTDLVGKAIHWRYGNLAVVHVYSSEHYYRLTVDPADFANRPRPADFDSEAFQARMEERRRLEQMRLYEEPGDYIKVKEGIYIFNANEEMANRERGSGNNLFFLMNLNRMHDVGRSFGHDGTTGLPENYTYGAIGEYFDASELIARTSTAYIR